MNWKDVPKFTHCHYRVNIPWHFLQENINEYLTVHKLDLNPDFQRGHVWTEEQQIAFVEYALKEPQSGLEIYMNHPNWMGNWKGDFVLVDGKQRLEAARRFLENEIPAYNCLYKDFTGFKHIPMDVQFIFNIAKLQTRAEVLKWYLDFNAGGTPHSQEEISKVREMLNAELGQNEKR